MSPTISPPTIIPSNDTAKTATVNNMIPKRSWDIVNREAKNLESDLDTKLLGLSRLTSTALRSGRGSSAQSEAESMATDIESGLKNLAGLIEELSAIMSTSAGGSSTDNVPPQHSATHLIQRHRDIHMEYVKELRKAKTHLAACLQPGTGTRPEGGASDYLLREADRINHISGITDHIIKYHSIIIIDIITNINLCVVWRRCHKRVYCRREQICMLHMAVLGPCQTVFRPLIACCPE